jgi:hypothetical protein
VRGLQSKLHGELALLAVRIEENDRRAMKRRKLVRRWIVAGIGAGVAVVDPSCCGSDAEWSIPGDRAAPGGHDGGRGITIMVLLLHNEADEQEHTDRYHNWFGLTERGEAER